MSNEEKMRQEFMLKFGMRTAVPSPEEAYTEGVKACAAIKNAEIAELRNLNLTLHENELIERDLMIKESAELYAKQHKELLDAQAMIKDLREATEKIAFMGMDKPMQADGEHFYQFQLRNCIAISAQALANSEHHNSRALEKMLLEAELKAFGKAVNAHPMDDHLRNEYRRCADRIAELNKDQ